MCPCHPGCLLLCVRNSKPCRLQITTPVDMELNINQGGRRRGRQRKRWENNLKDWTGLEWNILLRKAENREEWRKLVIKSTVVPLRSARLRDRKEDKKKNYLPASVQLDSQSAREPLTLGRGCRPIRCFRGHATV